MAMGQPEWDPQAETPKTVESVHLLLQGFKRSGPTAPTVGKRAAGTSLAYLHACSPYLKTSHKLMVMLTTANAVHFTHIIWLKKKITTIISCWQGRLSGVKQLAELTEPVPGSLPPGSDYSVVT